jgi:hypothetical protein
MKISIFQDIMLIDGDRKVCKSAIAVYLGVIKRTCNQGANKSNHPN